MNGTFELLVNLTGAAFGDGDGPAEVARLLRRVADQVEDGAGHGKALDVNGNRCGSWGFELLPAPDDVPPIWDVDTLDDAVDVLGWTVTLVPGAPALADAPAGMPGGSRGWTWTVKADGHRLAGGFWTGPAAGDVDGVDALASVLMDAAHVEDNDEAMADLGLTPGQVELIADRAVWLRAAAGSDEVYERLLHLSVER